MKPLLWGSIAVVSLLGGSVASAADLPVKAPVYAPVAVYSWTGFYIGGNVGGAWARGDVTDSIFGLSWDAHHSGFIGGGQVGANYQFSNFVIGVEWDFDWTSISATGPGVVVPGVGTLQGSADTKWITTVAARFGVAWDRALFYGKAGGGWVGNEATITNLTTGASVSQSNTNSGWLVGVGLEYAFTANWTAKIEYDYLGLRSWTWTSPGVFLPADTFTVNRNIQMLKVGVNYKFGYDAPVAARY